MSAEEGVTGASPSLLAVSTPLVTISSNVESEEWSARQDSNLHLPIHYLTRSS